MAFVYCVTGLIRSDENGKTTTLTTLLPMCKCACVSALFLSPFTDFMSTLLPFPPPKKKKTQKILAYFSISLGPAKLLCRIRMQCAIKVNVSTVDVPNRTVPEPI